MKQLILVALLSLTFQGMGQIKIGYRVVFSTAFNTKEAHDVDNLTEAQIMFETMMPYVKCINLEKPYTNQGTSKP